MDKHLRDVRTRKNGTSRRSPLAMAVSAILAVTVFAVATPVTASAVTVGGSGGNPLITTGFQIDGDKSGPTSPPGSYDWNDVLDGTPRTGPYTTPEGYPSTGIVDASFNYDNNNASQACGDFADSTSFGGGAKIDDNPWNLIVGATNAKSDGCTGASAYEIVDVTAGGEDQLHYILYQYWTRLSGNGDMTTYQIIAGPDAGRCDDYLLQFDYDSAGGGSTSFSTLSWNGGCAAGASGTWAVQTGPSNMPAAGAVGSGQDSPPSTGEPETFGESAIDLTAAGVMPEDECVSYTTEGFITRTGNSQQGSTIDYVGFADPLTISNCNALSVTKQSLPAGITSADQFTYVVDQADGRTVHDGTLAGSGAGATDADASTSSITSNIQVGQTQTWSPVIAEPDYRVNETNIPAGWELFSIVCTYTDLFGSGGEQSVVLYENGEPTGATFPVFASTIADAPNCVITNATSGITISKVANGAPGTVFTFDVNGRQIQVAGGTTSDVIPLPPGTAVTIGEVLPISDPAWVMDQVVCDDADQTTATTGPVSVTTVAGQVIDCEFTNHQLGRIVVIKNVAGADGTFDFIGDWTDGSPVLPAGGEFDITTSGGTGQQVFDNVTAGSYSLSETQVPEGYEFTSLACADSMTGTASSVSGRDATVNLDPGETVTCTYNNSQLSTITVRKETLPADYPESFDFVFSPPTGSAVPFALAPTDAPWNSGLVSAGTYTVEELAETGWDLSSLVCSSDATVNAATATITLPPGANVECVYTNTARPGLISLTKTVTGATPDYSWQFDVALSGGSSTDPLDQAVTTADPVASWGGLEIGATYTVTESVPDGWRGGDITCIGVSDEDADAAGLQFTVTPGLSLDCAVTNEATLGRVDLSKSVVGVPDDYDWSFDVTLTPGPTPDAATQSVSADDPAASWSGLLVGSVQTLLEMPKAGWISGEIACVGVTDADPATAGLQFTVVPGLVLDCTVTNTAVAGEGTITKTSIGGDGSFVFTLTPEGGAAQPVSITTVGGTGANTFLDLTPGLTYAIAESDPGTSWIVGALTCSVTRADGAIERVDPDGFIVEPGDSYDCAALNTAKGTIVIVKNVRGDDGTFGFTGTWTDGAPALPDDGVFRIPTDEGAGSTVFTDIAPGDYTVTETDPTPGYDGTALSCVDSVTGRPSSATGLTGTIALDPGETVVCTFSNTQRGQIVVDKRTTPAGDPTAFDFDWKPLGGSSTPFELADESEPFSTELLPPDTYVVTEAESDGWESTGVQCVGGEAPVIYGERAVDATFDLNAGETVLCTFQNTKHGPLTVEKTVTSAPRISGGYRWTIEYTITVTSGSDLAETYDLNDALMFGDGIRIVGATATTIGGTVEPSWNGQNATLLAADVVIAPFAEHRYVVTAVATASANISIGSADCRVADTESGTGFLNTVDLVWDRGDHSAVACAELPQTTPPTAALTTLAMTGQAAPAGWTGIGVVLAGLLLIVTGRRRKARI